MLMLCMGVIDRRCALPENLRVPAEEDRHASRHRRRENARGLILESSAVAVEHIEEQMGSGDERPRRGDALSDAAEHRRPAVDAMLLLLNCEKPEGLNMRCCRAGAVAEAWASIIMLVG